MTGRPKKILIVDDDPQVHKMLATVLAPRHYTLDSAEDGPRAWEKIQSDRPDLIILDIMMPEMSGIELCEKIRADASLKDTLILMLSAKDTQNDRLKGLQYGADDYVTKPFHVATLVHKIEHMLK
ncbi:MAG: response regulator [Deltaproteobacteria bacterium]|nr:response regulator [Deltaproteobacteria bacterium]